jgi:hypothetical protein
MTILITLLVITTIGCGILFYFYNQEKQQRIDEQAKTRAMSDYIATLQHKDDQHK